MSCEAVTYSLHSQFCLLLYWTLHRLAVPLNMIAGRIYVMSFLLIAFFVHSQAGKEVTLPQAIRIAPPPMTFDNVSPKCWNFTHGNYQDMEFYSPGFPKKYTNDTDCVLYLEAPQNFVVQLDFRETFKIENSENCKYDFLEVRDGPFAYSPLIQRYCGETFPPLVTSTSRYLWLRFKSDDLIQDDGFRAIYSYIKDSTQNDRSSVVRPAVCRHYLEVQPSHPDGMLSSAQFGTETSYHMPRPYDCTWEIHTGKNYGIYVRSYNLTMRRPQRCDENYVALYKRTTLDKTKYVQHCAGPEVEMKTRENRVFIRMYGKTPDSKPELNLIYTIYKKNIKVCSDGEFRCDEMCLPNQLLCNGIPNCPDADDEHNCAEKSVAPSSLPLHTIVAGSIGGVLFTAIIIGICVSCHYKRRDSQCRQEDINQQQKLKQKNVLEMAVSTSSTATHSLSRQSGPGCSPTLHHTQLSPKSKDNPQRYSLGSSVLQSSDGDPVEGVTDINNYKRFLNLEMTPDEESSPCHSLYSQTGVLSERYPALESQYPRFTSNVWRNDDHLHYPYTSLKKNSQFSVSKPYSYSPDSKYINTVPSLKYTNNDLESEH